MNTADSTVLIPHEVPGAQPAIRSRDVVIPALLVLGQAARSGVGQLTSNEIAQSLEPAMPLSAQDKAKLSDRTTRFSRTIRNTLVSHGVPQREGWVRSVRKKDDIRVLLEITEKGQVALFDHLLPVFLNMLPSLQDVLEDAPGKPERRPSVAEGAERVLTDKMVTWAVLALVAAEAQNGGKPVSSSTLRRMINAMPGLTVAPQDLESTSSSKMPAIDRTILNLISHDKLVKMGLAVRVGEGRPLKIASTPKAKVFLLNNEVLKHLPSPPALEAARARMEKSQAATPPAKPRRPAP